MANISLLIFSAALFFAPLAFGTVEHWSITILEVLVAVAALFYYSAAWLSRQAHMQVPGMLPLLLLLGLMAIQIVPLPPGLLKLISPHAYAVYSPVVDLVDQGRWLPLSLNQKATIQEFFRISCYATAYVLAIQLFNANPLGLKRTINVVVLLAIGIAFVAILQQVSSPDKIYWVRSVPQNAHPVGPWINPNQFSGYVEMISPLALAMFLFFKPRTRSDESWRQRSVALFTQPEANRYFYYGFGTVLLVLAVFISLCRGGIVSVTLAGMFFIILYNSRRVHRGRLTLLFICCSIFLAISWFGWDVVLAEFGQGFDNEGRIREVRLALWKDVLAMIKDYPVLGAGFGTFGHLYPSYKSLSDNLVYDHAHNDYLELLTDGGLLGFLLAAWFVLSVLRYGWKKMRSRGDRYVVLVGIGAMSGIFAMLVHGLTDFNMRNGAVGFYFFFLCALLVSIVNVRFSYASPSTLQNETPAWRTPMFAAATGLLLLVLLTVQTGVFLAGLQYDAVAKVYISGRLAADRLADLAGLLEKTMRYDPLEGQYPFTMGTVQWFQKDRDLAQQFYLQAVRDSPTEGAYLQRLGFFLAEESKGGELIREGYLRAQNKDELAVSLAEWLLWKNRREEAAEILKKRLEARPQLIEMVLPLLEHYAFSREELAGVLPPSAEIWLRFGAIREERGNTEGAEFYIGNAFQFLGREKQTKPQWFQQIINFYRTHGQEGRSKMVLQRAIEAHPDHASFHIQLGEYYEKEGIVYRAKEEYERALVLEPSNESARRHLRRLGFADSY